MSRTILQLAIVLGLLASSLPQDRFDSGDLKGFTRSPTEHIINQLHTPILTDSFKGQIKLDLDGGPLKDALVEIRDSQGIVRGSRTDSRGRFHFQKISPGTYAFKVTLDGFQSVVGQVQIKKHVPESRPIVITLRVGV